MLSAFGPGSHQVTTVHARRAIDDTGDGDPRGREWLRNALIGAGVLAAALGIYWLLHWYTGVEA